MSKKCSICTHKNRCQIDELILSKTPYRTIAHEFKIKGKDPVQTIKNHVRYNHIPQIIKEAEKNRQTQIGLNIQKCAQEIYDIATGAAQEARSEGHFNAVGSCLGPAAKVLDILSKGSEDKPQGTPKESGYIKGYLGRAEGVYAKTKDQSPSN